MITITSKNTGVVRVFDDKLLPEICLQLCGGGYNQTQVANAMLMQNDVLGGKKVVKRLFSIEMQEAAA